MPPFRNILLAQVVGIIILHSLIPHQHHGEMTFEEHDASHETAKDIADSFGLIFQNGFNYNFKYFIHTNEISLEKTGPNELTFLTGIILPNWEDFSPSPGQYLVSINQIVFTVLFPPANGLRAPPYMI